jgi:xylan 1,4-beta-xylosidase
VRGLEGVQVWWTEWGVTPTHFYDVTDSVYGAPFVLHGMKSAQGRIDALAYWVVSDHFEELGRAERLLHGGFGLMTIGNLRKPRWWALALAEQQGHELLDAELTGDGAGSLVDAWVTRHDDGTVDVLAWNGSLEQAKAGGDPLLDRTVRITVSGLGATDATLARIDHEHSNLAARWDKLRDWPTREEWERLQAADRLDEESLGTLDAPELELRLPQPGVARLRFRPRE